MTPHTDDWFTLPEAARLWNVSDPALLRQRIRRGTLTARKVGRDWLVHREEMARVFGPPPMKDGR